MAKQVPGARCARPVRVSRSRTDDIESHRPMAVVRRHPPAPIVPVARRSAGRARRSAVLGRRCRRLCRRRSRARRRAPGPVVRVAGTVAGGVPLLVAEPSARPGVRLPSPDRSLGHRRRSCRRSRVDWTISACATASRPGPGRWRPCGQDGDVACDADFEGRAGGRVTARPTSPRSGWTSRQPAPPRRRTIAAAKLLGLLEALVEAVHLGLGACRSPGRKVGHLDPQAGAVERTARRAPWPTRPRSRASGPRRRARPPDAARGRDGGSARSAARADVAVAGRVERASPPIRAARR